MPAAVDRANAIRALAMDAVQQANSGHPGAPMGMADIAEVLWRSHLRHSPGNPAWANRDRFVLSNGHGSMLLYALLHLTGYDLSMDDIRGFRQLHSKTAGHPEYGYAPGIETTTGPLGQGLANAVGMALAEALLANRYNRPGYPVVDHRTWVFVGDGCLMEGISHEVCSLAGTLRLGKLIAIYDDNNISIDGEVDGWFADDTAGRFRALGWHVVEDVDGHDAAAVDAALRAAAEETGKPSLVMAKTVIGKGSPNLAGTAKTHGAPLGAEEIAATREAIGWSHPPFEVPEDIRGEWDCTARGAELEAHWRQLWAGYEAEHPELARELQQRLSGELPEGTLEALDAFARESQTSAPKIATRQASKACLDVIAPRVPALLGGSADLTGSNGTKFNDAQLIGPGAVDGNYVQYGVREFGMTAIGNGLALHGGVIPYSGTFLVFMEYARNAVRLAALMGLRNILVYTHDSLALGEDGPTHQPVEQLANLRTTPNLSTWRPCDQTETALAWAAALANADKPTALVLSRQGLETAPRTDEQVGLIARGGYVLKDSQGTPKVVVIATGSEVQLALAAAEGNPGVRVVSMPSADTFLAQDAAYRESVLPAGVRARLAVEAGHPDWWYRLVGLDGAVIGVERFGASAPGGEAMAEYGFTVDNVRAAIARLQQH